MKLFFISDIHGSYYYLKKAIDRFNESKADYLVILGDILYHGPRNPLPEGHNPKEVAALLNKYADKIIAVRGNCEAEVDELMLDFPVNSRNSFILYNGRRLFLTHGHIYNEDNMPKLACSDVLIYGHTHIPKAEVKEGIYILNPGSIALPKENNPNSYGMLEDNVFSVIDFEDKVIKEIEFK
jgi:putative phosphoesterase